MDALCLFWYLFLPQIKTWLAGAKKTVFHLHIKSPKTRRNCLLILYIPQTPKLHKILSFYKIFCILRNYLLYRQFSCTTLNCSLRPNSARIQCTVLNCNSMSHDFFVCKFSETVMLSFTLSLTRYQSETLCVIYQCNP